MNEPSRMDTGIISYPVVVRREGDADITKMIDFDVKPFSNKAIIERLKQRAPFNLTDGAWLQRIQSAGPVDDVRAHLFWYGTTKRATAGQIRTIVMSMRRS